MRATAAIVGFASSLALIATGAQASAADHPSEGIGSSRMQLADFSATTRTRGADDRARRCIGKKKVRRARVFVTYKRLNRILGKKGTYWGGTYRVWDVCYSSYDLAAYVQKKKGRLRVYDIDAPLKGARGRAIATGDRNDSSRRCITRRTVKRKVRPYMSHRRTRKVLGRPARKTPTTAAWKGCFGTLKLSFDKVKRKRRVDGINVISAA